MKIPIADLLVHNLPPWGLPDRKARSPLQREMFSPRVLSFVMSFEGNMVLNAEL